MVTINSSSRYPKGVFGTAQDQVDEGLPPWLKLVYTLFICWLAYLLTYYVCWWIVTLAGIATDRLLVHRSSSKYWSVCTYSVGWFDRAARNVLSWNRRRDSSKKRWRWWPFFDRGWLTLLACFVALKPRETGTEESCNVNLICSWLSAVSRKYEID